MKLFLASSFNETASLLVKKLGKSLKGKEVMFIDNASDVYTGEKWWVKKDRDAFLKLSCKVVDMDLRKISKEDFTKQIKKFAVIHFCGGSVLYLISLIKEKGFDKPIIDSVREDKNVYSGSSAGSIIVSKDLGLYKYDDEETERAKSMKDFSGLAIVDFIIIPHVTNKEFTKNNKTIAGHFLENKQPVIAINDSQVVWVEDKKLEILNV